MKVCPRCRAAHPDDFTFCPYDATPIVEVEAWSSGSLHGGYQILEPLPGEGTGERFLALHRDSGERRIVRVLEGWWLASAPYADRFRQEIARAPLLAHPHAARVDGLFEPAGDRPFIAEEETWGPSLRQILDAARQSASLAWTCRLARQIAGALEAAHALGLVHGGIRPGDVVFLDPVAPGDPKVRGFGLGALRDSEERSALELIAGHTADPDLPLPSPSPYAAPERLPVALGSSHGEVPDPRSDLYSLGVLLFEVLTGALPPRWSDGAGPLPRTTALGQPIPLPLARLVGRLLDPDSDRRPRSARDLLAELAAVEEEVRSVPGFGGEPEPALLSSPPAPCDLGSVMAGRFRIERRMGGGDLGQVFAVVDREDGSRWALKRLRRERLGGAAAERVASALAPLTRLRHPGLGAVHAVGEAEDGSPFLVLEPVEGADLTELTFPVPLARVCFIGREIAVALTALHAAGTIHGDLKPRHVRLASFGGMRRWRLLDAGLAPALMSLVPGLLAGTPGYLAPERRLPGAAADPRSDLYSLGVVLQELLAGRLPAAIPERLQFLLLRLVEADPRWRPEGAGEVSEELAAVADALSAEKS